MYTVIIVFEYGSEVVGTYESADQATDRAAELRAEGYMVRIEEVER